MDQKGFLMSQREPQRYYVISKTIDGRINTGEVAELLLPSQIQVFGQKAKIKVVGYQGIFFSNRGGILP